MNREGTQDVIVMTGATAGLGAYALKYLAQRRRAQIIVGARGSGRTVPKDVELVELDLASLASVRGFAQQVKQRLGSGGIDMLILNAGMQYGSNDRQSKDGYELTFAVNHLAHYLLVRLLLPCMANDGRIVITTSDTHDPAVTPMGPKVLDLQELAKPSKTGFGTGIRAYAASKLCNILTAQSLARQNQARDRNIRVIAFNPGLTGGTSLGRDSSGFSKVVVIVLMHTIFRVVALFRPEYAIGKPQPAGEALAKIALGEITIPNNKLYVSLVKSKPTFPEPSELARNSDTQDLLWQESARMVGID